MNVDIFSLYGGALEHKDALCTKWQQEMLLSEISKTTNGISIEKCFEVSKHLHAAAEIYTDAQMHTLSFKCAVAF